VLVLWSAVSPCGPAAAQALVPPAIAGGAGGAKLPAAIIGGGSQDIMRHRGLAGKPCLTINGSARPYAITPNVYDHLILAVNDCNQRLRVQVCYFGSTHCVMMDVAGRARKEVILGTTPGMAAFRYEFREQF